jgi:hypothetical protein
MSTYTTGSVSVSASVSAPVRVMTAILLILTVCGFGMLCIGLYVHDLSWTPALVGLSALLPGGIGLTLIGRLFPPR